MREYLGRKKHGVITLAFKYKRLYINGRLSAFQTEDMSSILFGRIIG